MLFIVYRRTFLVVWLMPSSISDTSSTPLTCPSTIPSLSNAFDAIWSEFFLPNGQFSGTASRTKSFLHMPMSESEKKAIEFHISSLNGIASQLWLFSLHLWLHFQLQFTILLPYFIILFFKIHNLLTTFFQICAKRTWNVITDEFEMEQYHLLTVALHRNSVFYRALSQLTNNNVSLELTNGFHAFFCIFWPPNNLLERNGPRTKQIEFSIKTGRIHSVKSRADFWTERTKRIEFTSRTLTQIFCRSFK